MKKILLFLLLLSLKVVSQSGFIIYKAEFIKEINPNSKVKTKLIKEEVNLKKFQLRYNKEKSYFFKEKVIPKNKMYGDLANILLDTNYDWFQYNGLFTDKAMYNEEIKGVDYQIDASTNMKEWNLENETKLIDGYVCYKATRKEFLKRSGNYRKYVAWYTPEIPVPFGPIGNGGLPGLILQLQKGSLAVFTVEKIVLNPKKNKIQEIKDGKLISVKEMIKLKKEERKVTPD